MKWIIPMGLILSLTLCAYRAPKSCKKDLQLLSAEKQTIFGGVAGSPVVTIYKFKLKAKRSFTFHADTAWAEGKYDAMRIDTDSLGIVSALHLKKGQILTMHFEIRSESSMGGGDYQITDPGSPQGKAPVKHQDEVVVRYKGGKCKYLFISNIKTIETIFAP